MCFIPEPGIMSPLGLVPCVSLELLGTAFSPSQFRSVTLGGHVINRSVPLLSGILFDDARTGALIDSALSRLDLLIGTGCFNASVHLFNYET